MIWFALPASHILLRNLVCRLASHSTYNDIFPWIGVTNVKYPCWEYFLLVRNIHKGSHFFPGFGNKLQLGLIGFSSRKCAIIELCGYCPLLGIVVCGIKISLLNPFRHDGLGDLKGWDMGRHLPFTS